ncbi:MAG: hypothetical protein ACJ76F_09260 [Bacteroidia bacterium]
MNILDELSSRKGTRKDAPNRKVAHKCIMHPELLKTIAAHLHSDDLKLAADCAEVLTETAKEKPELVAKYAKRLIPLLKSKHTFARFESMHCMKLIAHLVPATIESILPELKEAIAKDQSIIVRDRAIETLSTYAAVSKATAAKAYPYLLEAVHKWGDRHAHQAMSGFASVAKYIPASVPQIKKTAETFTESERAVVKKAALKLLKSLNLK